MTSREELLAKAQYFVDCKYVARADERQKEMGLAYIEAERQDLAREIVNFTMFAIGAPAQTQRTVSQEALDWAASESEKVEAYKAANPDWQNQTRPAREVLAQGARDEDAIKLADEMQSLGYPEFGDCLSLKAYNLILKALRASSLTSTTRCHNAEES